MKSFSLQMPGLALIFINYHYLNLIILMFGNLYYFRRMVNMVTECLPARLKMRPMVMMRS